VESVLDVAFAVAAAFERCRIDYFLGGSLASSFQGEPRATNDIDFVVSLSESKVADLADALGANFYIDTTALRDAVRERRSWNIIHLPTVIKVDLLMRGTSDYDQVEFSRRRQEEVRPGELLFIKSAEDTVLRKLLWYQAGGGISDRQWRDLVGVLRHSGDSMDSEYLERWAKSLTLSELLRRAWGAVKASC